MEKNEATHTFKKWKTEHKDDSSEKFNKKFLLRSFGIPLGSNSPLKMFS
jgi:hypothetical protein